MVMMMLFGGGAGGVRLAGVACRRILSCACLRKA